MWITYMTWFVFPFIRIHEMKRESDIYKENMRFASGDSLNTFSGGDLPWGHENSIPPVHVGLEEW